jgi:hypothetical protein
VTAARRVPLVSVLIDPSATLDMSGREWNDLLIAAREHALLPRLAVQLADAGLFERAPKKARSHMRAAGIGAESTHTAIRFEVSRVLRALAGIDAPVVLLKGAAYVMASLPPARGRFVGDLDFMVPRDRIDEVEEVLVRAGWAAADLDDYDQRYYREWAHEIPPLQHPERETPLDVHHTIVPLTSRVRPDAAALFAASVPLDDSRLRVLGPADMVLHSAVHLFNDDVGKPLRDLLDLDDLLLHFGSRPGFWDDLVARARLHGLGRPLYHMLRQRQRVLGRGVPPDVERAAAAWAPGPILNFAMDRLFAHRFACDRSDELRAGARFANWLLYVRSHWLRMPLPMLVRHLSVKALRRVGERFGRLPQEELDV